MSHDKLCPVKGETWCVWPGDKCATCNLIACVREDERQSIVSFMRDWIATDPVIRSDGPDDIWSYGYGVRFALTRIEALGGER